MFGFLVNFLTRVFESRKKRSEERNFREFIDLAKKQYKFANPYVKYAKFIDSLEAAYDQLRDINSTYSGYSK